MLPDDRDFGPAMARLTQRQRIFVDGLFCGLKQTAAARRAGYSNRGHADAVVSLKSRGCQRQLLHPQPMRTNLPRQTLHHDHCSWLLQRFLKREELNVSE